MGIYAHAQEEKAPVPWFARGLPVVCSQPMGNAKTLAELSYTDILVFGRNLGLPEKLCEKEINKILVDIIPAADELYKQVQSNNDGKNIFGELRMLREIIELVVKEIVPRIQKSI